MNKRGLARKLAPGGIVAVALAVAGCAVAPPPGPSIAAMPGKDKPLEVFQQDDAMCRQYAAGQTGIDPASAATQTQFNSAALGTVLGAGLGAAIGAAAGNPGLGAAIGAGSGALLGTAQGADAGAYAGATVQQHYDISYAQCMASRGNTVPAAAAGAGFPQYANAGYAYPPYPYSYAYPYYPYYGPAFVGPEVFVGFGHRFHHRHW